MEATIKDGFLTVRVRLSDNPPPSNSGKTRLCVYEKERPGVDWKDRPLTVQITAYIPIR